MVPEYGGRMLSQMLLAYSFAGMVLCLFHQELLTVLSNDNYKGAGSVIAPLVLANGFMFASTFMECAFYVRHRTILKPFTALVGTIVTIVLYAVLIPRYSILGAAYATLLGYATMAVVTYSVAQRTLYIKYKVWAIVQLIAISVACYLPSTYCEVGPWQSSAKLGLLLVWMSAVWHVGILHFKEFFNNFETKILPVEVAPTR